jgi:broad specificity phosphatase PhoE
MVKPLRAAVVVHIFRHGEKKGEELTPKGIDQAINAGQELRALVPKKAVVKAYSGPASRVQETRKWILYGLGRPERLVSRVRESIGLPREEKPERVKALFSELGQEEYVRRFVEGTLEPGVAEPAVNVAERLRRQTLGLAARLAGKRKGPLARLFARPIHLIYATHQGGMDRLVGNLTHQDLKELGGLSGYLERLSIEVPYKGPLRLHFRGKSYEVPRERALSPREERR